MARFPAAQSLLHAAEIWRDRCLIEDGSVFTDERIWTKQNLAELEKHFVQNLDYGQGDFFTKLEAQLGPAAPSAKKLAAEMFWVMYLIVSSKAIGAETKEFQIRQVWRWSGDELPHEHPLLRDVLEHGVSHPGTAYNTHRWRELVFFITMMRDFKDEPADSRRELLRDPWRFATWVESREHAAGRQFRHILLFLLFPDHFERIVTGSHKRAVVREMRKQWGEDPDNVDYSDRVALDREVLRVRERLASESGRPSANIDFYSAKIQEKWRPKAEPPEPASDPTKWPDPVESEAWIRQQFGEARIWLIATGGGGRLWKDFEENDLVAIDLASLSDLSEYSSREELHAALAAKEGRINPANDSLAAWQFAREMKTGDVVIAKQGRSRLFGWGVVTGEYNYEPERSEYQHVRSVDWKARGQWQLKGDQKGIATKTLTEFRQYPEWSRWALELMGVDDRNGDRKPEITYTPKQALEGLFLEAEEFTAISDSLGRRYNVILQGPPGVGKTFVARRLAYALIGRKDPDRVQLVQFHQSYSYEDFVQGWRPNAQGGFVLSDGVFRRFCQRAAEDPSREPFVFIIDEINRGNLSRILGELMMLIEHDKRGPEHAIPLTYSSGEGFFVPDNVYILGLMNTADRSLAMVDYALRRRFVFIDVPPAFGRQAFSQYLLNQEVPPEIVTRINSRMMALNEIIRADRRNLGPGFEIGHSYFVPSQDEESLDDNWYQSIIMTEISPLLREYWFDDPGKADDHLRILLE